MRVEDTLPVGSVMFRDISADAATEFHDAEELNTSAKPNNRNLEARASSN